MAGASREIPPLLGQDAFGYYQTFSKNISDFLLAHGTEISLPKGALQGIKCWFVKLSDGTHLHVYAEATGEQNATCDQCRIIGWGTHPVSSLRYHFIIPAEIGPDSLQDPAALPHIAEACFRSKKQVSRAVSTVSLPTSTVITAEGHISPYNAPSTIFDSTKHRLHGVLHSNGFGHLLRVNGREGGSQSHTGFQLVTLWDALCQGLRARKVTTEDVSSKIGMELRILFTAAYGYTWYGTFGYEFGRGPYNTSKDRWLAAMHMIQTTSLAHILHDFEGVEDGVPAVVKRYRLPIGPGAARVKDLGSLLYRLLYLQSNPKDAVQFFENKTVAEAEAGIKAQDDAEAAKRAAQRAGGNGGQFGSGNSSKKAAVGLPKLPPQPQKNSGAAPPLPKIKLRLGPGGPAGGAAGGGAAATADTTIKGEKLVSFAVSPTKQKRGRAAIEEDRQDLVASPSAAKRSRATAPPRPIIGRKVRVYYKDKRTWYHGTIEKKDGPAASNRYIVAFKNFKDNLDLSDETNIIIIEFADGPAPVLGGGGGASGSGVMSVVSGKMKEGKKKQQVPEPVAASPRKKAPGGGGDGGEDSITLPEVGSKVKVYNPDRRAWKSALVTSLIEVKGSKKSAKQKSSSSIFQITFLDGSTEDLDFSEIKWQLLEPPQSSPEEEDSEEEEEESDEEESDSEEEEEESEEEEEDAVPPVQYKAVLSRDDGVERTRQLTRALKSLCPLVRDVFGEAKGRAQLDAILDKLSKGGCPELTYTKTWWESLPKLLRWAQTGINGAVGRGVKDAGKAVRLVGEFLQIDKAQLHALGLFPEVWPAPFQITAVKKANAKVIAQMEKEKLKREKEAEKRKLKLKQEKAREKEKEKDKKVVKVAEKKKSGSNAAGGKQEGGRATRRSRNDDATLVSLPDPVAPPLPRPAKTTAATTVAETAAKKKGKHAEVVGKPEPAAAIATQAAKKSTTAATAPLASPPPAATTTAAHLGGAQQQQQQQQQATAPRLPPPPPSLQRPNSVVARAGPLSLLPAPALRSATASPPLSEEAIKQLVAAPKGLDQLPADRFSRPPGTTLPVLILPSDAPPWGLDRLETALNHVMAIAKAHKGRWVSPQRVVTLAQQSFSKLGLKDISLAQAAMAYLANTTFQGCAVHRYAHPEGGNYYFTEELPGMYSPPLLRAAPAAAAGPPAAGATVASPLLPPPHPPRIMSAPTAPALGTALFNPTTAQKNQQQVVKVEDTNTTTTGGKTRNSKRQKAVDGDDQGAGPSKPPPGGSGVGGVIPVISGSQEQNNKGNKFKLRLGASSAQQQPPPSTVQQPKTGISRSAIQQQAVDHALAIVLAPVPSIALLPAAIPPPQIPKGAVLVASPPPPPPPAWLSLVPGAPIRQPPSMQNARNQVSRDLHHVFTAVLKVYAPLIAKQAAENAALVAGERATTRVLKLKQFAEEVQVMRDTKHFLKPCSGETLNPKEGPVPPKGQLRIWCKLAMPIELASPPVAPTRFGRKFLPVDPPAELIVLPKDATLGQFMAASQELYRGIYRMCANFTASGVVSGLYVGGSVGGGGGSGKSGGASGSKSAPLKSPMAAVWDPSMPLAAMLPKEPPHPGPALSTLISSAADGGGHGALAGLGGASGSAAGGIINTSNPGFAAGVFIPTITIAGVGLDTTPVWLHAGGPEDWIVGCNCGTRDDDGEAMVACDSCGVWYHTRCVKVPDDCPSYVCTLCEKKRKHTSLG